MSLLSSRKKYNFIWLKYDIYLILAKLRRKRNVKKSMFIFSAIKPTNCPYVIVA